MEYRINREINTAHAGAKCTGILLHTNKMFTIVSIDPWAMGGKYWGVICREVPTIW